MTATATIDGRRVAVRENDTILSAARRAGIPIPTLCHVQGLAAEGGCRLCVVDVAGAGRPQAACHTPLEPGTEVRTDTPALSALRRNVLQLVVDEHPDAGFTANPSGAPLERLMAELGVVGRGPRRDPIAVDASHPYLRFERARCITCRRCLLACSELQGQDVYAVENRGAESRLVFGGSEVFAESPCVACGACVDLCPSGALSDRDREDGRAGYRTTRSTRTTCGYCGVGCQLDVETNGKRILRIAGTPEAAVNRGHLCVKGRYSHAWQSSQDRLKRPMLRTGSDWHELTWPEAMGWTTQRLNEIREAHGPDALGVFTSSRSTNEAAYLLQKLFRTVIGTNNVDCCARVCHSSTALALQRVTGTGAASASYTDLERASCIVVAGANPTEAHPVLGARIKRARRRGAALVVIDPRRIELAEDADVHLALRPGTNVALFNALAKVLLDEGAIDRRYVEERLEGFEDFAEFLGGVDLEKNARLCGVDLASILAAARRMSASGPPLFVHGLGLSELTQGTASVMALCNLGMLLGSIGRPGAGMLPLRGQNNVQGNADMGAMPGQLTGYQTLTDPELRDRLATLWGSLPPEKPGLTIPEMLEAAQSGQIRGLWIQGEDVAQSDPNERQVLEALRRLDLLIVQELFFTETARHAHLVLPAASVFEQDGTFTNGERRIQRVRRALPPPGDALPDWQVARDVANAMGANWHYASASRVMDEIAWVAPRLFGGVNFARLEPDGIQWPCPTADHAGTECVHADGFLRGRGSLVAVEYEPSPEDAVEGYPYCLVTGRVLDHYNVGSMTRRTPNVELEPDDRLEIHPDDAKREGIADGAAVSLESRWGATCVPARITSRVRPGTLFLSFHFPETHANRLTGSQRDPESNCPEYKVTAVRIAAA
ncbi:MAG: formate dehydrogenase subunit alpha [Deltaproteobacteria bacterium]|nr:formate dehydrogenase subunit alpha [Deltaproteobacteria bacterium]